MAIENVELTRESHPQQLRVGPARTKPNVHIVGRQVKWSAKKWNGNELKKTCLPTNSSGVSYTRVYSTEAADDLSSGRTIYLQSSIYGPFRMKFCKYLSFRHLKWRIQIFNQWNLHRLQLIIPQYLNSIYMNKSQNAAMSAELRHRHHQTSSLSSGWTSRTSWR